VRDKTGTSQGRCDVTLTERFVCLTCVCPTYDGNLGPCKTFETGDNGRCVWCDHAETCHVTLLMMVEMKGR